ncbi:MAG: hypothetical protein EXR90_00075 [Methyloglobulus sp.]|nr:hypothetical protein [Methyloglobulus sp.]
MTVKVSFEKFSSGILDVSKIGSETLKRTPRQEDMKEFSSNGYGHVETLWGNAVTTTNPTFLPINKPINDIECR